ncbi:MAG TPA: hypothetical protein ENJ84_05015 [Gammaproteobacteria bacterium]|nr:hypothetical protein [Gammaproteobacteria bacterium]
MSTLKEVENLGDLSGRVRNEIFAKKNYIDDDFDDLYFCMDWVFFRSMGVTAKISEKLIRCKMKGLRGN